jgi:hypothetical protein
MRQVSQKRMVHLSLNMATDLRQTAFVAHRHCIHNGDGGTGGKVGRHNNGSVECAAAACDDELEANAGGATRGKQAEGLRDEVVEVFVEL